MKIMKSTYENQNDFMVTPVSVAIRVLCTSSVIPIAIGWLSLMNTMDVIIDSLMISGIIVISGGSLI